MLYFSLFFNFQDSNSNSLFFLVRVFPKKLEILVDIFNFFFLKMPKMSIRGPQNAFSFISRFFRMINNFFSSKLLNFSPHCKNII